MNSDRFIFWNNTSTIGTPLSGVPWIYLDQPSTSTYSLVRKHEHELGPRFMEEIISLVVDPLMDRLYLLL